jgi:4-hydroxy-tetrahydrodipicolinate reductase
MNQDLNSHSLRANIGNIRLHSVRLQGYESSQEVIWGGIGQTLKIRHDLINTKAFLPGIILACKKVVQMDELVYGLENIF